MPLRSSASHPGQSGFSLLEVLIASTIMGLVITAMVAVVSTVERTDTTADQYRQARILLKEEMENVSRHYSRYAAAASSTSMGEVILDANPQAGNGGIPVSKEIRVSDLQYVVGDANIPCKQVRATLTWMDQDQKIRSMTLFKLITDLP